MSNRHNRVKQILIDHIRKVGGSAIDLDLSGEFSYLDAESRERPDIEARIGGDNFLIDVTIILPTAKSHVAKALKPLGAAISAGKAKIKKHGPESERKGVLFIPYVVETYGGLAPNARDFNKFLANYGVRNEMTYTKDEIFKSLYSAIAVAVQEGNRKCAEAGFQQASLNNTDLSLGDARIGHAESLSLYPSARAHTVALVNGSLERANAGSAPHAQSHTQSSVIPSAAAQASYHISPPLAPSPPTPAAPFQRKHTAPSLPSPSSPNAPLPPTPPAHFRRKIPYPTPSPRKIAHPDLQCSTSTFTAGDFTPPSDFTSSTPQAEQVPAAAQGTMTRRTANFISEITKEGKKVLPSQSSLFLSSADELKTSDLSSFQISEKRKKKELTEKANAQDAASQQTRTERPSAITNSKTPQTKTRFVCTKTTCGNPVSPNLVPNLKLKNSEPPLPDSKDISTMHTDELSSPSTLSPSPASSFPSISAPSSFFTEELTQETLSFASTQETSVSEGEASEFLSDETPPSSRPIKTIFSTNVLVGGGSAGSSASAGHVECDPSGEASDSLTLDNTSGDNLVSPTEELISEEKTKGNRSSSSQSCESTNSSSTQLEDSDPSDRSSSSLTLDNLSGEDQGNSASGFLEKEPNIVEKDSTK